MTHKLTREAFQETMEFLAAHQDFSDDREVLCVTPFSAEKPSLTLGTVRALYALAADFARICEIFPEEIRIS